MGAPAPPPPPPSHARILPRIIENGVQRNKRKHVLCPLKTVQFFAHPQFYFNTEPENLPQKLHYLFLNPFLFIRGLSCPCRAQISLTQNCLYLTISGFPCNLLLLLVVTLVKKKKHRSRIGLEIRPQSAFIAFRALLPSANYSADSNGRF